MRNRARRYSAFRNAGVVAALAIAILCTTVPAFAAGTAVFSSPVPAAGATVLAKPTMVTVTADDSAMLTGATVSMNGIASSWVMRGFFVGHDYYDEENECDAFAIDDWTIATIIAYFPSSAVVVGSNTIITTVTSSLGTSTYSRTFVYGAPTAISAVTPVSGAVLASSPSSIAVSVTTGATGFSTSSMTLDGAVVSAPYNAVARRFTYTPSTALAPGQHTVVFSARDAQGGTVSRTWSFRVTPPMSNGSECTVCHTTYPSAHPVAGCEDCHDHGYINKRGTHGTETPTVAGCSGTGPEDSSEYCHQFDHQRFTCTQCHSATYPAVPRHTDAAIASAHVSSTDLTTCGGCHSASLVTEHGKYPSAATIKYQCDLCHGVSAPQQVKNAVSNGSKACSACHGAFSHGDHTSTVGATPLGTTGMVCGYCHATDLGVEHAKATSSAASSGCAACHPSPRSTFTTWGKGCVQGGCHVAGTATQMHGGITTKHTVTPPGCTIPGCHAGSSDLSAIHVQQGCSTCHGGGKTPSAVCGDCHDTDAPHGDLTPAHRSTLTSATIVVNAVSFGVHDCSECHSSDGLISIHGSGNTDCMKCHPTPKSTLTPTWNKSCVQGGCHTGSTATMHASIDSDHAPGSEDASCVASNCHPTTSLAALHQNATGIVDGTSRASCAICHGAGTPTKKTCATCHPDRVAAHGYLTERHLGAPVAAAITIDAVAYSSMSCAQCHDTELGPEHQKSTSSSSANGCTSCHPNPRGSLTPWDKTTCAQGGCHTITSAAPMHAGATDAHERLADNDACFVSGCHGEANLAQIHVSGSDSSHSPARTSCMICHSEGVPTIKDCANAACHADKVSSHYIAADHLAAPANETITISSVSYGSLSCSGCHALGLLAEHSAPVSSSKDLGCAACHPTSVSALGGAWTKGCTQGECHTVTSSAPKHAGIDTAHARLSQSNLCLATGCHVDGSLAAIHLSASRVVGGVTVTSCAVCHSGRVPPSKDCTSSSCHGSMDPPHADSATTAVHESITTGCGPCHTTALPTEHAKYPTASSTKYTCAICHGASARQQVKDAVRAGNTACTSCHAAAQDIPQHAALAGDCTSCHTSYPTYHPVAGCEACHNHGYIVPGGTHGRETPTVAGCIGSGADDDSSACHVFIHRDWYAGSGPFACEFCHSTTYPNVPRHWVP